MPILTFDSVTLTRVDLSFYCSCDSLSKIKMSHLNNLLVASSRTPAKACEFKQPSKCTLSQMATFWCDHLNTNANTSRSSKARTKKLGPIDVIMCEKYFKIGHLEFVTLRFPKSIRIHYFEILKKSTNIILRYFSGAHIHNEYSTPQLLLKLYLKIPAGIELLSAHPLDFTPRVRREWKQNKKLRLWSAVTGKLKMQKCESSQFSLFK